MPRIHLYPKNDWPKAEGNLSQQGVRKKEVLFSQGPFRPGNHSLFKVSKTKNPWFDHVEQVTGGESNAI